MAISGYTKDDFGTKLGTVLSAAQPIRSVQHLKGREEDLEEIDRALYAHGRHIFVHGARGVGKSSLAATAAYQYQSSDAEPIFVSGSPDDTFTSIIANIALQALGRSKTENVKRTQSLAIEFRGLKWSAGQEVSMTDLGAQIKTISDAAELLKQIAEKHSKKPTVVLDEFDTIHDPNERGKFASLLKVLGDQNIEIKFFITGVAESVHELLGAHLSAHRQLATLELPRLGYEGRREIVIDAAQAFQLDVDDDVNWRIALISDGFPYYVHLIVEKMLWEAFMSDRAEHELTWDHFYAGLRVAVKEANAELRRPYEQAVLQRPLEYEDVLWSTADGDDLFGSTEHMFQSYQMIIERRTDRPQLERARYSEIVRKLRGQDFGAVLQPIPQRPGWYEYREKMLRGYVRMQAEANGIPLKGERPAPKQRMYVGNIRTGYRGPSIPRGVKLGGDDKESK
jgi:uncharacterized protein